MEHGDEPGRADASGRGRQAEALISDALAKLGWRVARKAERRVVTDLVARRGKSAYAVEVKAAAEGRGERLVPLWAQAYLQATHAANAANGQRGTAYAPLAVVAAPRVSARAAEQVLRFAAEYAPGAAVGVVDLAGLRRFRGPGLDGLDAPGGREPPALRARGRGSRGAGPGVLPPSAPATLFSDLNQWLLKLLLAPALPEHLLAAPRARYRNASQLARAAGVSVMSAFRLVRQLADEGHLDAEAPHLALVRREDLLRRWQAAAELRPAREVRMRYLLPGDPAADLRRVVGAGQSNAPADPRACLALFAAADALGLGVVEGVPAYVYVPRLDAATLARWPHLAPAAPGEPPDVVVRQAPAPRSVFRGTVRAQALGTDAVPACDVLQVWLDVAAHPARGREQADQIRARALAPLFDERFDVLLRQAPAPNGGAP